MREMAVSELNDLQESMKEKLSEACTYNAIMNRVESGWPSGVMNDAAEVINQAMPIETIVPS
jgi:hypothetical protein